MNWPALETILPPPTSPIDPPTPAQWLRVQEQLGTQLPPDYQAFLQKYGTGSIADFLLLFVPCCPNPWVDLLQRSRMDLEAYRLTNKQFSNYYLDELYPHPDGLLAWGGTDHGDVLFWRTRGDPCDWTVAVYDVQGYLHLDFPGTLTDFLTALLTGQCDCPFFPRHLLSSPPLFRPLRLVPIS